jgi:hypothetical protein
MAALCILAGCGGDHSTTGSQTQLQYQSPPPSTKLPVSTGAANTLGVNTAQATGFSVSRNQA